MSTTITGKKEKHNSEIKEHLDLLRQKIKVRDMKLSLPEKNNLRKSLKRSSSADATKSDETTTKNQIKPRSTSASSADGKEKSTMYKNVLKKNLEKNGENLMERLSNASPTMSILKTSSSPRTERKKVKFNSKDFYHQLDENSLQNSKEPVAVLNNNTKQAKLEMKLNWIMTVSYNEQNLVKNIKTIENFDKTLKSLDQKSLSKYDIVLKNEDKPKDPIDREATPSHSNGNDNNIYVFECKKWLAKDSPDKKIERVLKPSNILRS